MTEDDGKTWVMSDGNYLYMEVGRFVGDVCPTGLRHVVMADSQLQLSYGAWPKVTCFLAGRFTGVGHDRSLWVRLSCMIHVRDQQC